jgi:hypothetical protein
MIKIIVLTVEQITAIKGCHERNLIKSEDNLYAFVDGCLLFHRNLLNGTEKNIISNLNSTTLKTINKDLKAFLKALVFLLILAFLAFLISCQKPEKEYCWYCETKIITYDPKCTCGPDSSVYQKNFEARTEAEMVIYQEDNTYTGHVFKDKVLKVMNSSCSCSKVNCTGQ